MNTIDIDDLIREKRNKIWMDKINLGQQNYETSFLPTNILLNDSKEEKTTKRIDTSLNGIFCGKTTTNEPVMATMVRYGEYSPLNPNLLSPGSSLLGLGEYEEKRRQLMNRKKQEYREYLSKTRSSASKREIDITPNKSIEMQRLPDVETVPDLVAYNSLGSNTNTTVSHVNVATNTTPKHVAKEVQTAGEVQDKDNESDKSVEHLVSRNNQYESKKSMIESTAQQSATYLTPRERKLADLQVSGSHSPSFFASNNITDEKPVLQSQSVNTRRDLYKEELRKQIELKRQIDDALREKEKREEEAIARRVKEQQEKMKIEYLKEQSKSKEKQERFQRIEEFRRRQEELKKSSEPERVDNHLLRERKNFDNRQQTSIKTVQKSDQDRSDTLVKMLPDRSSPPIHASVPVSVIGSIVKNSNRIRPDVNGSYFRRLGTEEDTSLSRNNVPVTNFEDSLPIPVFRATSPIIPAARTSATMGQLVSANSKAMQTLEAKWQVPAVQKNNIIRSTQLCSNKATGCPKSVMTQLGAFRRQLQLEQMQLEEKLKEQKLINN